MFAHFVAPEEEQQAELLPESLPKAAESDSYYPLAGQARLGPYFTLT